MTRSTFVLLMTFALVTGSCGLFADGPQGPTSDVAREVAAVLAPGADVKDQPFEDLIARLDLQKTYGARADEVVDQIRKTRVAVAAASKKSSASGGFRLASLARSAGIFSIPSFAGALAGSLDAATKQAGTRSNDPAPYNSTEKGSTATTTTTLKIKETFTGSGAHVQVTESWNYHSTTTDNATGATLVDLTDERTITGGIDVCPDAAGNVPASVDVRAALVARTTASTTTRNATSTGTFRGTVDDQATLRSVSQQNSDQTQWESAAGNGGFSGSHSATWNVSGSGDYLGGLDSGSVTASVTTTGDATAADANTMAGWDFALDAYALEAAYKAAQDLWRHGRCVMIAAPDYSAETPIDVSAQESSQHQEEVDTGSETKFSVRLKHRFGGAVNAPVTAALTGGEKKIEPSRLESVPSTVTYKAPDEDDKKATAKLQSTSKRGIGTLVLDFHTGAQALTLSLTGTLKGQQGGFATSDVSYSVSIGPIEFKKAADNTWFGMGPWTGTVATDLGVGGTSQSCKGSEAGTASMVATVQTRGDKKVFVINRSQSVAAGTGTVECTSITPIGTFPSGSFPSNGGSAGTFMATLDDMVIPAEGGTIAVAGDRPDATGGVMHARGTAVATTGKK